MYRDSAHRPEDHDGAVGAIQIADGLIAQCAAAIAVLRATERPQRHERWVATRTLQDTYPEIWTQLDAARQILAARGANTMGFDELRGQVHAVLAFANFDGKHTIDAVALDDARRGIAELQLAMPGADWREIDARGKKLANTRLARRTHRTAISCLVAAGALAMFAWSGAAVRRSPKSDDAAKLRAELAQIVSDRRTEIAALYTSIGENCDRPRVIRLMQLYVMDGQFEMANAYGSSYELRCGEDMKVRSLANAPRPRERK